MEDDSDGSWERPCDGPQANIQTPNKDELYKQVAVDHAAYMTQQPPNAPGKTGGAVRWPHLKSLFPTYSHDIKTLLDQVTQCDCVNQPLASNANPKGNKWARLHLVMFGGGGGNSRGAFAFSELPKIQDACKLKKKVGEIWKYVTTLTPDEEELVDSEVVKLCKQQLKAYNENCARVSDTTDADRKMAALKESMTNYERQQGALPPGAKGIQGAGRVDHSTNTRLGQPATYAWSNAEKGTAGKDEEFKTPTTKKSRTAVASSQSRKAMDRLDEFTSNLSDISANLSSSRSSSTRQSHETPTTLTSNERKRRKLVAVRDDLQNQLKFAKDVLVEDSESDKKNYDTLKERYQKVISALSKIDDEELFG